MSNENIRTGISGDMRINDLSLYFNIILLFHEKMDATAQVDGINEPWPRA